MQIAVQNRKAKYNYTFVELFEAGIELQGSEIKSLRNGRVEIAESYAREDNSEIFLINSHFSKYSNASYLNHVENRPRKLLLHKKELIKLKSNIEKKGMTIVPLSLYLKGSWIKITIGVGKGKKLHDKRQDEKQKSMKKEINSALKR